MSMSKRKHAGKMVNSEKLSAWLTLVKLTTVSGYLLRVRTAREFLSLVSMRASVTRCQLRFFFIIFF